MNAQNDSAIDATTLSSTTSGDTGVGVALAFNTIGWQAENLLSSALDALIGRPIDDFDHLSSATVPSLAPNDRVKDGGTVYRYIGPTLSSSTDLSLQNYADSNKWLQVIDPFGGQQPAEVQAYITGSTLNVAGDLTVSATNDAQVNATVSNAATSAASALFDASGKSFGGILASNKVSAFAKAYLSNPTAPVTVGGALNVQGFDTAGVYANVKVVISSATTNDGGAGLLGQAINNAIPTDYRSDEGTVPVSFGQTVRLATDYAAPDHTTGDGVQMVHQYDKVQLADNYDTPTFSSDAGIRLILPGDVVQLSNGYSPDLGTAGGLYRFIGQGTNGLRLNLSSEDYTNTARWAPIGGDSGSVYEYLGTDASIDLSTTDFTDTSLWKEIHGSPGQIYQYMGSSTPTMLDLNNQDYSDLGYWKPLNGTQLVPQGLNITPSDSVAIGGLVVLNDVRSRVDAYIDTAKVTAGSVNVTATNASVIRAMTDNTSSSSGGDVWGKGKSLAATGVLSTNVVQGGASAYITGSTITTTSHGDLVVQAENVSQVDATTKSASISGANSYSFLLAFNTIGWEAQNVLFNTVDALLGDPLISNALGHNTPDGTLAYVHDTKLDVAGSISVFSIDRSQINSLVSNMATSAPSAFFGAAGMQRQRGAFEQPGQ